MGQNDNAREQQNAATKVSQYATLCFIGTGVSGVIEAVVSLERWAIQSPTALGRNEQ